MNIYGLAFKTALKPASKAGLKFASKVGTTVASALLGDQLIKVASKHDRPLDEYASKGKRKKKATERIIRDSLIAGSTSVIGVTAHSIIKSNIK